MTQAIRLIKYRLKLLRQGQRDCNKGGIHAEFFEHRIDELEYLLEHLRGLE